MTRVRLFARTLLVAALGAALTGAGPASATTPRRPAGGPTFTVNSLADVVGAAPLTNDTCETASGNGICTLRAAIMEANHSPNGPATINLPAGLYALAIPKAGPNGEATGDLNITASLNIVGAGAEKVVLDGSGLDRLIHIGPFITVTISGLTLRNGSSDVGGGLRNVGRLTLTDVIVRGNTATDAGGGVALATNAYSVLHTTTIDHNYTPNDGGGLSNNGDLWMYSSLVSSNQASREGGGLYNAGYLTATNSTISNNSAEGDGGGLYNEPFYQANLYFSTVAGNLADSDNDGDDGGGLWNAGQLTLRGVLLAENYAGADLNDCATSVALSSLGYNLLSTSTGCTLSGVPTGNLLDVDPRLQLLHNNGGPTLTRALPAGSPAINVVPVPQCLNGLGAPLTEDQRGSPRPAGGACDIGAFEGSVPTPFFGRNLIRNGDAEASAGSPSGGAAGVPGWELEFVDSATVLPYGIPGGWPLSTDPGPPSRGENYFAGGVPADPYLIQTLDVSAIAGAINSGTVRYMFEGYLGGFSNQQDQATAYLTFRSGANAILGSTQLGPVTNTDRGNQTSLLRRTAGGFVPPGTVAIEIELRLTAIASSYNDGYADNLSLVLGSQLFLPLVVR